MTISTLKSLLATAVIGLGASAYAQGTPPNPSVTNPAMGAGQQTQQGTSMGTTGVPAANVGSTMPNTAPRAATMSSDNMAAAPTRRMRAARADRN